MIVVESVSKFYGARQALKDISFEIEKGEVVGFLGLNGAGKTTMLKILSGLLLPSAGGFRIDGVDGLKEPREVRRRIGFLPDRPPLYEDMTVRQTLAYAGRLNGVEKARIDRRVDEVVEATNLTEVKDDLVAWLSHGFRQRVGIAQTIVHDPDLVILDEPISGLDPVQIVDMRGLVKSLAEKHTVLLSSHILAEISQTCDQLLVLSQGRIVARGTEADLKDMMRSNVVELIVRTGPEKASLVAKAVEGVAVNRCEDTGHGLVRLLVEVEREETRELLVAELVREGVPVRRVAEVETGLESVFIKLTGEQKAPALSEAA